MRKKLYGATPDINGAVLACIGLILLALLGVIAFFCLSAFNAVPSTAGRRSDGFNALILALAPIGGVAIWMTWKGFSLTQKARFYEGVTAEIIGAALPGSEFSVSVNLPLRRQGEVRSAFVRLIRREWGGTNCGPQFVNKTFETVIDQYDAPIEGKTFTGLVAFIARLTLPAAEPTPKIPPEVSAGRHYYIHIRIALKDAPNAEETIEIRSPFAPGHYVTLAD